MAAHRYWRLLMHASGEGDANIAVAELQGMTVLNGPNVLTGGTASASSIYAAGYEADKAFDGNKNTFWCTATFADGTWLEYDLGAGNEKDIIQIAYYCRADGWFSQAPTSAEFQYSDDGATWTTQLIADAPVMTSPSQRYDAPHVPGVNIGKANIAIASHPPARITASKANIAIGSHPPGRVIYSKSNISIESDGDIPPPPPPSSRRRILFVS